MARLPLNRTAWAGLALFILSITTTVLIAKDSASVDSATKGIKQLQMEQLEKELKIKQAYKQLIEKEIDRRTAHMQAKQERLKQLAKLLNRSSLSKEVQAQLIGNAIQTLYETRTDIAVKEGLVAYLEELLKTTKPSEIQLKAVHAKIHFLEKQQELAQTNEKRMTVLYKNASISHSDVLHSQIELEQVKAKLVEAQSEAKILEEMARKPIADKIIALRTELVGLKIKNDLTEKYLAELSSGASISMDIQSTQNQIDALQKQIDRWLKQLTEVQAEICNLDAKLHWEKTN